MNGFIDERRDEVAGEAFAALGQDAVAGAVGDEHAEALAVVGMAAIFTDVVRAPLTGLVLVVEMTGNYGQMLPLMVACFTALVVAEAFKLPPV